MNYTDKELELAPRVAEIMGPWEPKEGDWIITEMREVCVIGSDDVRPSGEEYLRELTWLPTLTQCLDWLRGRGFEISISGWNREKVWRVSVFKGVWKITEQTKDLLEAAYRCVIAVGEGEK